MNIHNDHMNVLSKNYIQQFFMQKISNGPVIKFLMFQLCSGVIYLNQNKIQIQIHMDNVLFVSTIIQ